MAKKQIVQFPKRFLWGASISAHQAEGGTDNQWNAWELENAKSSAAQAQYKDEHMPLWDEIRHTAKQPENYISADASDHKNRFEEDFSLLELLNMNAFRFSIEWSRIEPQEGTWDTEAVQYYREYFEALSRRGIEPVVTLLHFTLPVWFVEKGGFEKRSNVKYFLRYVEKIANEYSKYLRYIITINEPEVYAHESYMAGSWPPQRQSKWLGWRVLHHQLHAHRKAAKLLHQANRRFRVSIAKNSSYCYPGDDAILSRMSAAVYQYLTDDYTLRRVYKSCDFIGVNYYFSNRFYGYRIHNPEKRVSDLDWALEPENLQYVLERLSRKYKKPLLITENGLADQNDEQRKWWIGKTIVAMQGAIEEGVRLEGYLHWSLLDNFEWAYGHWPKFGLVAVDRKDFSRTIRPSAIWFGAIIKGIRSKGQRT